MSKVKLKEKISNYIKVLLITLVIILSTGGSVWARQYVVDVYDNNDNDNDKRSVAAHSENTGLVLSSENYCKDQFDKPEVFCTEKGDGIRSSDYVNARISYDNNYTEGNEYSELPNSEKSNGDTYYVYTKYNVNEKITNVTADFMESLALATYNQDLWWDIHGDEKPNISGAQAFFGALGVIENTESGFSEINNNEEFEKWFKEFWDNYKSIIEEDFDLSELDTDYINDYNDVFMLLYKLIEYNNETLEKLREPLNEVLKKVYLINMLDGYENLADFKPEDWTLEKISEIYNDLYEQVQMTDFAYEYKDFADEYLDSNGQLKDGKLSISQDEREVLYDEETQTYKIGPISINYPDVIFNGDTLISGLVNACLVVNDNGQDVKLDLKMGADPKDLKENEFTLSGYDFDPNSNYGYPKSGEKFYINVKYKENRQYVSTFFVDYRWHWAKGSYDLYDATYKKLTFQKVEKEKYLYENKNNGTRTWYYFKQNNNELEYIKSEVYATTYKCVEVEEIVDQYSGDGFGPGVQALVVNGGAEFYSIDKRAGIEIPVSEQITVKKDITNGATDDTFHFLVAMESDGLLDDGKLDVQKYLDEEEYGRNVNEGLTVKQYMDTKLDDGHNLGDKDANVVTMKGLDPNDQGKEYTIVNSGEVKAGESAVITLPERYTDSYPDIKIVETDEYGRTYLEYSAEALLQEVDSMWSKYTPSNGTGYYSQDNNGSTFEFTMQNNINEKHGHIVVEKMIKKLPTIEEAKTIYFDVRINDSYFFFDGASNPRTAVIPELLEIKLTDNESEQYQNQCGTIKTFKDGDYYKVVFVSEPIPWDATQKAPNYSVVETDQFGKTYSEYSDLKSRYENEYDSLNDSDKEICENSVWNYYLVPVEDNSSGTIKECTLDDSLITNNISEFINKMDGLGIAKIENASKPFEWNLDIKKINTNPNNKDIVNFKITEYGVKEGNYSKEYGKYTQDIEVITNSNESVSVSHSINNAIYDAYFIRVEESENTNYLNSIEDMNQIEVLEFTNQPITMNEFAYLNPGQWIVDRDGTGKITQAVIYIDVNGKNTSLSITAENDTSGYTSLKIEKEIEAFDEQNINYPEEFYFKASIKGDDGNYLANDVTNVFFDENSGLVSALNLDGSQNGNRKIVKVTRQDESSNTYSVNSRIYPWSDFDNPPVIKVEEVDQYGYTYNEYISNEESRGPNSIWEKYEVNSPDGQILQLKLFDNKEAALNYENKTTFVFKNKEKYKANLTVRKRVEGAWDEDKLFYVAIDVKQGLNLQENEDFITKYFPNANTQEIEGKKVLVLSKENPSYTSEDIIWYSNEYIPKVEIYEVDNHGQRYYGSEENIQYKDSLWHDYTPTSPYNGDEIIDFSSIEDEKIEKEFVNTSVKKGGITITKELTDGEFREDDEFYFKVYELKNEKDENGEILDTTYTDVTEKLFPDNVVDSKAGLFSKGYSGSKLLKLDYNNPSATSIEIEGEHVYNVVEVDIFEVTYRRLEKLTKTFAYLDLDEDSLEEYNRIASNNNAKIWGKDFIPNGTEVWRISVNNGANDANDVKIKFENIVFTSLKVEKDFVGEETDEEFTANLHIFKNKYTKKLFVDEDGDGKVEEVDSFNKTITISKDKPFTLDRIGWTGDIPIWEVNEIDLPDGWMLAGYKFNDNDLSQNNAWSLSINSENKVVIVNKQVSDDGVIQITKQLVDSEGNPKTLSQDFNALFEVYFNNSGLKEGDNFNGYEVKSTKDRFERGEGYEVYISVPLTIPAGQSSNLKTLEGFKLEEDLDLEYKIVELDPTEGNQVDYGTYLLGAPSDYWNKTRPYKQTKDKIKDEKFTGVWTGKITNKSKSVSVLAQNEIRIIDILFKKMMFNNQVFPVNQNFYFQVRYSGDYKKYDTNEDFIIRRNSEDEEPNVYEKKLELVNLDDKVTVSIEEHDSNHRTYSDWLKACEESGTQVPSDVWENYMPFAINYNGTIDNIELKSENNLYIMNTYLNNYLVIKKQVINSSSELDNENFEFNFKVFENVEKDGKTEERDVTNEIFKDSEYLKDGFVVINKDNYLDGVTSTKTITKTRTFIIKEYDYRKDGITYEEYKNLKVEERKAYNENPEKGFWGKTYIPEQDGENKDGKYTIKVEPAYNGKKVNFVVPARNFKVTDLSVVKEVYGNISDDSKDIKFPVKVSFKGNGKKIWIYNEDTALFDEYTDPITLQISVNNPGKIKGIAWESKLAPKVYIEETLPEGWVLYNDGENNGYKNNGIKLDPNNTVTLTVMNEKPDDVSLQITKNITDLNGNPTSLYDNDFTAKFEVYIKGDTESNIQVNGNPAEIKEIQEGSIQASRAGEGYNKYIEVNVTIPKSDKNDAEKQYTNAIAKITGLGLAKDGKIDYKVVEIDPETGIDYSQYKDSSNQTESSFWKKSKPSNGTGVWADSISKNDKGEYTNISVSAYDQIRNVNINFDKHVKDKDGKEVGLANGEKFYFNVEYDKYSDKNVTGYIIGKDENGNYTNELHENYTERFELLDLDEVINVKITETDGQGHTYGNCDCETSDVWSIFTPTDDGNDGIITKTVDANTDGDIVLDGYNQEKSNTLTIKKVIANSETTDFLDTEHFYFRVFEGDTDVTSKLFSEDVLTTIGEDKYIELNKDRQSVTSTTISRLHTYTIKEYDDKGFLYENREKSSSDFWKTGFVPANNGVWEVKITPENLSGETPAFKEAVNYRVVRNVKVQKELAESDVTDENKKKEFPVKVTIKPRTVEEKTTNIKFVDKDGNILLKEDLKDITANDDGTYTYEAKVSAEKAKSFPYGIIWDGPAPEWNAVEHDLPKGWTTVGYKVNDGELTTTSEFTVLNSNGKNTIVVENEKDDRIGLKLTKKLVDSEGKDVTSVPSDFSYTAYFDIYLSGYKGSEYTIGDKTYNITEISSLGTKPSTYNEEDGFTGYIRESITISGGNTSASKEMSGFSMKKGSSIKYKIVETDAEGRDYSNRGDSEFWKTSIPGNETGIWTGELKANDKGLVEITAQNKVRIISINFTKDVIITDLNGNETTKHSSEFADREKFYFNIEFEPEKYNSHNKNKYTINNQNPGYNETLYLVDWDDVVKVTITETDEQGNTYENRNSESEVWSKFAPKDGKGIFTGECKAQTDANIELIGQNDEFTPYYGQLEVGKTVKDKNNTVLDNKFEQQKQAFYFVVLDKDGNNVVNDLFENSVVTINNPDNEEEKIEYNTLTTIADNVPAIEVHAGKTVKSNIVSWMSNQENPVYKVKEVDQFNQTYSEFTKKLEENKEETLPENLANSIWNDYKSTFGDGEDVKLEASPTLETIVLKSHTETNTFVETYKFGWNKTVNNGGMIAGENFFFEVRRNTTDSTPLGKEALLDLFPDLNDKDIQMANNKALIHFHVDKKVDEDGNPILDEEGNEQEAYRFDSIESRKVEIDEKYYVTEVDSEGNTKNSYGEESLWNTYTLDGDGTFEFSKDTDNYQTVDNKLFTFTVNISKVLLPGQSSDRDFKFKLYINGKDNLFKEFTVKANETKSFSFELGSIKDAPQIDVEEVDGNLEKILVNGKTYTPFVGTEDGLVYASTDKDSEFTFEFTNDVEHKGLLNLEKIITDGKSDVSEYSNKEYKFEYTYTRKSSDGEVIQKYDPKIIVVKAGGRALTDEVTWYDGEYVECTLKEVDADPENITTNNENLELTYNKDTHIATCIVPELTEAQIKDLKNGVASEDTNNTIEVSINNKVDWKKIKLEVDKAFESYEKATPDYVINQLMENENINEDTVLKFTSIIKPNEDSNFRYQVSDGSKYKDCDTNNDGYVTVANVGGEVTQLEFTREITLGKFLEHYNKGNNNINHTPYGFTFVDGGKDVVVEYLATEPQPIFETPIEEKPEEIEEVSFIQKDNGNKDGIDIIKWSIINFYDDDSIDWTLTTTLAGIVWEDGPDVDSNKGENKGGYSLDGIYDTTANPYDKPLEGITVKVIRQIIDANGNVVKETPNSDTENFIYGTTSDRTETNSDGQWKFKSVSVPAFTSNDKYVDANGKEVKYTYEDGYRVKYDVEFYYDGIKYEPTKLFAEVKGGGNAKNYINEVTGTNPKEVLDRISVAKEDSSSRDSLRSKYATVEADPNDPEMKDDYSSNGIIKDADGNISANISYVGQLNSNGKVVSKGEVTYGEDLANYAKATTSDAGLRYFFTDYKFKSKYDEETSPEDVGKGSGIILDESSEKTIGKTHYHGIYNYATHINLGLVQREQADLSIDKAVVGATVIVNKNHKVYTNFSDGDAKFVMDNLIQVKDEVVDETKLNIYTSDYDYRVNNYAGTEVYDAYNDFYKALFGVNTRNIESLIKTNELQVYFTYRITVNNESKSYPTIVESIDDYSDSKLTYVDVKTGYNAMYQYASNDYTHYDENGNTASGLWAYVTDDNHNEKLTNLFEGKEAWYATDKSFDSSEYINDNSYASNEFNKAKITVGDTIDPGEPKDYFVVYRVNLDETDSLDINDKYNYAEISSFAALEKIDSNSKATVVAEDEENKYGYAGVIDTDSAPGNFKIGMPFEDDTDYAKASMSKVEDNPRSITGTAMLDKDKDGDLGGKDDVKLPGITTKLVEVIDLPDIDNNGNYKEYEFYYKETTSDKDGEYTFNNIVAGNYIVRFMYGDKSIGKIDDLPIINGVDYKTTTYEKDKEGQKYSDDSYINNEWLDFENGKENLNEARDNEARRLALIEKTQRLNNKNTSIFDVANYKNQDKYVEAKQKTGMAYNTDQLKKDYSNYKAELFKELNNSTNGTLAYNDIIYADGYAMFADTAKVNLKVNENTNIGDMNLGLELRPETKIYLDKQVKEITLTDNGGAEFFHINYDIHYYSEKDKFIDDINNELSKINQATDEEKYNTLLNIQAKQNLDYQVKAVYIEDTNGNGNYYEANKVTDGLYVALVATGDLTGLEHYLEQNDVFKVSYSGEGKTEEILNGYKYINIDSQILNSLDMKIKYQITAINLGEADYYGNGLDNIINGNKSFTEAIDELSSSEYYLANADATTGQLNSKATGAPKKYGEYLGHAYYEGQAAGKEKGDQVVTTTVRQIVDYVDNNTSVTENENSKDWILKDNNQEELNSLIDNRVFTDGKIMMKDGENIAYNNEHIAISQDVNNGFVKELQPKQSIEGDNEDNIAKITMTTLKQFSPTDDGDSSISNFAEILEIENTVGRRDMEVVYGDYNPRGGSTAITGRDETFAETVQLTPPTGNQDNDRAMLITFGIIGFVTLLSGGVASVVLRVSGKKRKNK